MAGISTLAAGKPEKKYKYNGKELQHQEFANGMGLEWYDYGARMYDPQIGRWHVQDNFSEVYLALTPYQYAANNPPKMIDEAGKLLKDKDGNIIATSNGSKSEDTRQGVVPISDDERKAGVVSKDLKLVYNNITVYADDGTSIQAKQLVDAYIETTYSPDKTEDKDIGRPASLISNCHGYTFAGGNIWIVDAEHNSPVQGILDAEYDQDVPENQATAAVIMRTSDDPNLDKRVYAHSGRRNADGTFNHDDDIYPLRKNVSKSDFEDGHDGTSAGYSTTLKYIKKKDKDKTTNTNSGIVVNGVRIVDQDQINQILKQLGLLK